MTAPQIDVFAQPAGRADVRWAGTDRDTPILYVGGVLVHLSQLGTDLRPWLLALSERLAEFAAGVGDSGERLSVCEWAPHYGNEPCECAARLAAPREHVRKRTDQGPDYCAPCSEAISEWVSWPCPAVAGVDPNTMQPYEDVALPWGAS